MLSALKSLLSSCSKECSSLITLAKEWTLREKQSWSSLLKFFVLTFALVRVGFCRARIQIRVRLPWTIKQGGRSPHKIVRPTSPDEIRCNLEVCLQGCTWLSKLLYGRVHTSRICSSLFCGFVGKIKAIQPSVDACSDLALLWRRKCQRWLYRFVEKVVKNEQWVSWNSKKLLLFLYPSSLRLCSVYENQSKKGLLIKAVASLLLVWGMRKFICIQRHVWFY